MPPAPPATTEPHIATTSFQGYPFPPDVANRVLNMLVGGSPFANSLSRYPTGRSSVAFPTASPDRPGWVPEMGEIPIANMNDDASIVAVCKLSTIVLVSNESVSDTSISLTREVETLLRDSASAELDRGCLYGQDSPEPVGVVAAAQPAPGGDLADALTEAIGSIGDAGGTADCLAARPSVLASARNTRDATGTMLYPSGLGAALGVTEVPVPELAAGDILAYDSSRVWLVTRDDFSVEASRDAFFTRDATALRLRGRFAIAAPVIAKSLRRLVIEDSGSSGADADAVSGAARAARTRKSTG